MDRNIKNTAVVSLVILIILIVIINITASIFLTKEIEDNRDVIINTDRIPIQNNYLLPVKIKEEDGVEINAIADFELHARVLSTEGYRFDKGAIFSPVDLALGWRDMAKDEFLSDIKITQSNRFYYWYTENAAKFSEKNKIIENSANMHMVPANSDIEKRLKSIDKDNLVYIKGRLVKINTEKGWYWNSSTTRKDTGAGACEIVYVEELVVL